MIGPPWHRIHHPYSSDKRNKLILRKMTLLFDIESHWWRSWVLDDSYSQYYSCFHLFITSFVCFFSFVYIFCVRVLFFLNLSFLFYYWPRTHCSGWYVLGRSSKSKKKEKRHWAVMIIGILFSKCEQAFTWSDNRWWRKCAATGWWSCDCDQWERYRNLWWRYEDMQVPTTTIFELNLFYVSSHLIGSGTIFEKILCCFCRIYNWREPDG